MQRIKNFCKNNVSAFIVSGCILFACLVLCVVFGIFPFGNNTLATYDAWAQICPFYTTIFDFLDGKQPLFYTSKIGGGFDTFGSLSYIAFSPFSFLMLVFGRGGVFYAYTFSLIVKLICTGFVASYFIRKQFENVGMFWNVCLSCLYALGGYFIFLHTWLPWVDFLIYMPLVVLAYKHLIEKEKVLPFSILFALMVATSYGIGAFSYITFVVLFGMYAFLCVEKEKRGRVLSLTVIGLFVAVLLSLGILVPNLLQFTTSARNGGIFTSLLGGKLFSELETKLATILGSGITLLLAILYFIKCDKKDNKNKFLFFAVLLLLLPVVFDTVNKMLNMGSYNSYAFRLGFIFEFLIFFVATKFINDKKEKIESQEKSKRKIVVELSIIGTVFAFVVALAFISVKDGIMGWFANSQSSWSLTLCYAIILICFTLFLSLILLNCKNKFLSKKVLRVFVSIVVILHCGLNLTMGMFGDVKDYSVVSTTVQMLNDSNISTDDRIKNELGLTLGLSKLGFQANTYEVFSSSCNVNTVNFVSNLDYNASNAGFASTGGSVLSDSILGYKYVLSNEDKNQPNLKKVSWCETSEGTVYLYENLWALGNAFLVNKDFAPEFAKDFVVSQQSLFEALGGTGEFVKKVSVASDEIDKQCTNVQIIRNEDGSVLFDVLEDNKIAYFDITFSPTYNSMLSMIFTNALERNFATLVIDEKEFDLSDAENLKGKNNLLYCNAGEAKEVRICLKKDVTISDDSVYFALTNYDVVGALLQTIKTEQEGEIRFSTDKSKIFIQANAENQKLILTSGYYDTYKLTNNGETYNYSMSLGGAIEVDLQNGENSLVFEYSSKYVKYFIIFGICGLLLAVAVIVLFKFFKEKILKISKIMPILYLVGGGVVFALFVAMPTVLFFVKIFL